MEKELIKYIGKFQLTDLLGFGNILRVREEDCKDFQDYITKIVVSFSKEKRRKRKQLLQLAKDVAENNMEYDKNTIAAAQNN